MENDEMKSGLPEGIGLYDRRVKEKFESEEAARRNSIIKLRQMNMKQPKNLFQTLREYRECTKMLIESLELVEVVNADQVREIDILKGGIGERDRKRWTPEEDDALVSVAADGKLSLLSMAVAFRRSPGAVSSRLTYLVGIRRLSQEVAGRVTGFIDGEAVDGFFTGRLTKSDLG